MSVLDFSTDYQKQKTMLAIYGLFIILATAFLGCWFTAALISPSIALYGGLMCVMLVGGVLGYFTVIIQRAVQEVKIKVVNE